MTSRDAREIAREKLIVALDVPDADSAFEAVSHLKGHVGAFKVGLQLFTAEGPTLVRRLCESGERVFLDVKYHDIPNTVAKAAVEAARLGVWMFNMHLAGGSGMIRTASSEVAAFCEKEGSRKPKMIGVTVLTSSDQSVLEETGIGRSVEETVLKLAGIAAECGLDGVVASAREVPLIRASATLAALEIVTPGIRPSGATLDDQKRVMTPEQALKAGSDYLVVGRPIMGADDRAAAADEIVDAMAVSLG